ncbi:hypothetical protein [Mycolicibacter minnesotensis]
MSDDLDDVLARIDELETDEDKDTHSWHDAAVWSPSLPEGDELGDDDEWHPDIEPSGLCAGDPVVLALTARDGSVLVSWDMDTHQWTGNSDVVRMVQTAAANAGADMEPFEQVGMAMMSVCDDLDAAPNIAVYVSVTPRPVHPAELLTAEHPDGRTVQWDHGEWSGDRELCLDADELRRRHAEPDSLTAVAEALLIVCAGGTMNAAVWAAAGVPF